MNPLRAYQEITNDSRVDEIFLRLGGFFREVGINYFKASPEQLAKLRVHNWQ